MRLALGDEKNRLNIQNTEPMVQHTENYNGNGNSWTYLEVRGSKISIGL